MKRIGMDIVVICALVLVFAFPGVSAAVNIDTASGFEDGYMTVLKKEMINIENKTRQIVHIKIRTREDDGIDYPDKATLLLNRHIGFITYLIQHQGWQMEYGINHDDPVDIELNVEARRSLVVFAYFYVCEKDKLWNQLKQRGSLDSFFHECTVKLEKCFREKYRLK